MIAQSTEVQPLSAEVMDSCLRRAVTFMYSFWWLHVSDVKPSQDK
jgi:hypothetical protein